ncbi:MAG TPA: (d)CMP kinase [Deltaproteobacteria bacterium]|jgi:cytidylate kinase|nr:(d)CMP kinase [Deltaproteobacteria bacterium]HOI08104.1 (d)CMP kinase [Deltaproteobacteria bacterium]
MKHVVVTIDGPAGTGKSTVAREVARRLGYLFLDTGALYRAAAVAVEDARGDIDDDAGAAEVVRRASIEMTEQGVFVNGTDVTARIRTNRISSLSSRIAALPSVRKALLGLQRSFREKSPLVAEGRDTGSVVFPDADLKFYLDASPQVRARRRYDELVSKGSTVSFEQVLKEMEERDGRDASRDTAPLVVPQHAVVVDTTHLDCQGVTEKIVETIRSRLTY